VTTPLAPHGTPRTIEPVSESETQLDRRAERRASRRAESRAEILDAAERVFGEDGIRDGSLRSIAEVAGFSTAAIYLFFENKQHLLSETLSRRADELNLVVRDAAQSDGEPLDKLHRIVDLTVDFFAERPHFRLLLRHIRGGPTITGPVLAEFAAEVDDRYLEIMANLARIVKDGQAVGQVRDGDERSIAHLYSVLINEFVLLDSTPVESNVGILTSAQFHELVDGALRQTSSRRPERASVQGTDEETPATAE
jgi:TetR/AcrR family transcriptional regulator